MVQIKFDVPRKANAMLELRRNTDVKKTLSIWRRRCYEFDAVILILQQHCQYKIHSTPWI